MSMLPPARTDTPIGRVVEPSIRVTLLAVKPRITARGEMIVALLLVLRCHYIELVKKGKDSSLLPTPPHTLSLSLSPIQLALVDI